MQTTLPQSCVKTQDIYYISTWLPNTYMYNVYNIFCRYLLTIIDHNILLINLSHSEQKFNYTKTMLFPNFQTNYTPNSYLRLPDTG